MLYLAALLGLTAGDVMANVAGLSSARVLVAMLVFLAIGLIGARTLHLFVHSAFYRRRPDLIWARSAGGAAQLGGLALMLLLSPVLLHALALPAGRYRHVVDRGDCRKGRLPAERLLRGTAQQRVVCLARVRRFWGEAPTCPDAASGNLPVGGDPGRRRSIVDPKPVSRRHLPALTHGVRARTRLVATDP